MFLHGFNCDNLLARRLSAFAFAGWLAGALVLATPAVADTSPETTPGLPQASLSAQVLETVEQDTVTITLSTQHSDASQAAVTRRLTDTLDAVMQDAKAEKSVKARSGNYRVWPHTDKNGNIVNWRGQASVVLESTDFSAASALASGLNDRMPIAGMAFSVSDRLRAEREQALLADAAQAFQARAQTLATAMGFANYRLRKIDLGGSGAVYAPPMPRVAMAAASLEQASADVPLEPGTETITMSVQGSIYLIDKK